MAQAFISAQAKKDFKKIHPKDKIKIRQKLKVLETSPFAGKKLGGKLKGFYSLRIWPYRAIYLIKRNKEIWITHIFHRQQAYK